MATITHTGTELETNSQNFFQDWFDEVEYFKDKPEQHGFYDLKDDHLNRKINWALYLGNPDSKETVIYMHHYDTVDVEDFGSLKNLAYSPYELTERYKKGDIPLPENAKTDLESGNWLFGRGLTDMKSGGAMQMALIEEYIEEGYNGNILLIAVPDEENSSAGMRSATYLFEDLHEKFGLEYVLLLDSEPHERLDAGRATIYDGSIGKIMPVVVARGKQTHVGQIYSGVNPINIMSEIVRRTELNIDTIEKAGNTISPPATWLYFKDRKHVYDVTLPKTVGAYMSILPMRRNPKEIMNWLKEESYTAFDNVIKGMEKSYDYYNSQSTVDYGEMTFKPKVMFFNDLLEEVKAQDDNEFIDNYEAFTEKIVSRVKNNEIQRAEASYQIIEYVLEYYNDRDPVVIIALSPPYYPGVNNADLENAEEIAGKVDEIIEYSKNELNEDIEIQNYFTGITDLSYGMYIEDDETIKYIEDNTLLWGDEYEINLSLIRKYSMPVLNIGAWGKDFHKYTERMYTPDLFDKTPQIIDYTTRLFLK